MNNHELAGKVQSVLGLIEPSALGTTLFHEHLLESIEGYFDEPTDPEARKKSHEKVTMENIAWVRNHRTSNLDNARLDDEVLVTKEANLFKNAGGNTIAEVSSIGLNRNPLGLQRISRATGLNIIMGSGYYVQVTHPPELASKTEDEIAGEIVRDITVGVDDTGVHSGVIGEIGCTVPFEEGERKVLRASAKAQKQTGAPLMIHPCMDDDLALEIVKILADSGADLSHTVICHTNVYGFSHKTCRDIADAGCYIGIESFGNIGYPHLYTGYPKRFTGRVLNFRGDLEYINRIMALIADGYLEHILIAHDICFKDFWIAYGGNGYAHILENTVPLMKIQGMTDKQISTLLIDNPRQYFPFAPVK
jgi:phosphotriesterase-related protein